MSDAWPRALTGIHGMVSLCSELIFYAGAYIFQVRSTFGALVDILGVYLDILSVFPAEVHRCEWALCLRLVSFNVGSIEIENGEILNIHLCSCRESCRHHCLCRHVDSWVW